MSLTINRTDRDALYDGLMTDLSAIGDVFIDLHNDEPASAKRLYRRFEVELRLLDDLGWEQEPEAERFELTMPSGELRPIIERIYWSAVGSLADSPEELRRSALRSGRPPREDPQPLVSRTSTAIPARRQTPTMNTRSLLAGGGRDNGSRLFDCS
jgi:hypothetical protein